jgi:energy-converting hydrogenase Eha subunit H
MHRFAAPEDVYRTVSSLVQDVQGEFLRDDLRRLIYIAVCCVDHRENEAEAYRKYRSRVHAKEDLREFTIRNYMSLVRGLVALMDGLYTELRHHAFEVLLLGERNNGHCKTALTINSTTQYGSSWPL